MKASAAVLLAWRTLQARPRRTAVLLLGYGLGVAVMIALLAVGDALLLQARDRDVVAGGDLILLPAGIDPEVLKTGAVTAMFLAIPNARFLVRQILLGPRYADGVAAASPEVTDKLVYVRVHGRVHAARASAALPSAARAARSALAIVDPLWQDRSDDRAWIGPSLQDELAGIDRFRALGVDQERLAIVGKAELFAIAEGIDGRVLPLPFSAPGAEQEAHRRYRRVEFSGDHRLHVRG